MTLFIVVATSGTAVSAGLVAVLPFVTVALSVLVGSSFSQACHTSNSD